MSHWVRWAFEYDDRSNKVGLWNSDGTTMAEKWQFQNLHRMITAHLQVKDLITGKTSVQHACSRDYFLNFAWVGKVAINPSVIPKGGVSQTPEIIGLQLQQTNGWNITAYRDGRMITKRRKRE